MTVMPRWSTDWTVDDLDQLPDDGLQPDVLVMSADDPATIELALPFPVGVTPSTLLTRSTLTPFDPDPVRP